MNPVYIVQDADLKTSGQTVTLTQGETKSIRMFLFGADGSPLFIPGVITEIAVSIYTAPNTDPITKLFSTSQVVAIADPILGCLGFSFILSSVDTALMASNSSGLPLRATVTLNDGSVRELDFLSVFEVSLPSVVS